MTTPALPRMADMTPDPAALVRERLAPLRGQFARVLVGQGRLLDRLLVVLIAGGHALIEGVPGLAKTLAVRTLAAALRLSFKRIQFTPDLLPADVVGTQIYNPRSGEFSIKRGPVFANIVLADEINRAPAKVQSALLEAMEERQATIGDTTFPLLDPFLVLATMNPIEQEGTYPLPEAQVDRFMMKLKVDYPGREDELAILDRMGGTRPAIPVESVLGPEDLAPLRAALDAVHIDPRVKGYIVDLVRATRQPAAYGLDIGPFLQFGASLRATLSLARAARGAALLDGRGFVTPQDVKDVALDVMRHRLGLTYEAEAEEKSPESLLSHILERLPLP
jgi:MoxR-like ATPase